MSSGSQDRRSVGFPTGNVAGQDWEYLPNFGGMGGGGDNVALPWRYVYWKIKVNAFSRLNKKLILHNEGFAVYSDSLLMNRVAYALIISDRPPTNDVLVTDQILSRIDIPANTPWPQQFEFDQMDSDKIILPQPTMATYDRYIYAIIDLLQTGRYIGTNTQIVEAMKTASLQFEGTP